MDVTRISKNITNYPMPTDLVADRRTDKFLEKQRSLPELSLQGQHYPNTLRTLQENKKYKPLFFMGIGEIQKHVSVMDRGIYTGYAKLTQLEKINSCNMSPQ